MKRQGNLINLIADMENLELAYYKAQKGKYSQNAHEYGKLLHENLTRLQYQIVTGSIKCGNYNYFTVYDPKKRLICAAPFAQRVLHHAIMNVCHPYFEKIQIFDSYASRPGKGTYAALDRAEIFNKNIKWFLKLDFCKYFDSIDHEILKVQLKALFKDNSLLDIFDKIIDSYSVNTDKGVPIGNLTSQYFANHYLAKFDHFAKEVLKMKAYIRYMDDIVLWHDDKEVLKCAGMKLNEYSGDNLKLTLKPFCLNSNNHGLPFLGYLIFPDKIYLSHRSRIRFIKKINEYGEKLKSGEFTQKDYQNHVMPLVAFTEHSDSREFRKKIIMGSI